MKKRILTGITALSLALVLTGCGSNTDKLTCTQNTESNGFKSEVKLTYKLKKNKITNLTETKKITLDGDMLQYLEENKTSAQNIVDSYANVAGIKATTESTDNSVTVTTEYDADTMDSTYKDAVNMNESYESLKEIKANEGYSCK